MKTHQLLPLALLLCTFFFPSYAFACPDCWPLSGTVYQGYPNKAADGQAVYIYAHYPELPGSTPTLIETVYTFNGGFGAVIFGYTNGLALFTLVTFDACAQKNDTVTFYGNEYVTYGPWANKPHNFYMCEPLVDADMMVYLTEDMDDTTMDMHPHVFENLSIGSQLSFELDFGDGTSCTPPNDFSWLPHIYAPGNYQACMRVSNALAHDSVCAQVTVPAGLSWPWSFDASTFRVSGCDYQVHITNSFVLAGNTVKFILHGTGDTLTFLPSNGIVSPIGYTGTHYSQTGIPSITRIIYAGTIPVHTMTLAVGTITYPAPMPEFTYTNNANQFTFTSQPTIGAHHWTFDNAANFSTLANPVQTFAPGTYNVCHTVSISGCPAVWCDSITVYAPATAAFGFTYGRRGLITFQNGSTGSDVQNPNRFLWDFGDGTTSTSDATYVPHIYPRGTFVAKLTVTGEGPNNTKQTSLTVNTDFRQIIFPARLWPIAGWSKSELDEAVIPATEINVFPNPFSNSLQFEWQSPEAASYEVLITNVVGQMVYAQTLQVQPGIHSLPVDLSQLEKGIYLVRVAGDEMVEIYKVVKE